MSKKADKKKQRRHENYESKKDGIEGQSKYAKKKQQQRRGNYSENSPVHLV